MTVTYKDSEFLEIGAWLWKNFNQVSGISFLPKDDHVYQQAPYEEITKEEYKAMTKAMPVADWSTFVENTDGTTASQELACTAGHCEIGDIS